MRILVRAIIPLILFPLFVFADGTPTPTPQIVTEYDLVAPTGVAHIEDTRIGARRQVRCVVTTNSSSAELTFDGRTIRLSDGYAVIREPLANTPGVSVTRVTVVAPDGSSDSMILAINKQSGVVQSAGVDDFARLLSGSKDAAVVNTVLPLVAMPHGGPTIGVNSLLGDCLGAAIAFVTAVLFVEINCGGGNVPGCIGSLTALAYATDKFISSCPSVTYPDGTVGWG